MNNAENNDTLALLIWVEDSAGNKDSVWIYVKHGATDGFDPELGEINLYGVEPQGDLDIRLVLRTDTNWYAGYSCNSATIRPYWLYDTSYHTPIWGVDMLKNDTIQYWLHTNHSSVSVRTFPENLDLKKCYFRKNVAMEIALKIYSKHPPIALRIEKNDFQYIGYTYSLFNDSTMNYSVGNLTFSVNQGDIIISEPNNIIVALTAYDCYVGVQDSIEHKTLYPNPAGNFVVLEDAILTSYNLLDNSGSILKTFNVETVPYQLDISMLPAGNYFIVDVHRTVFYKFIKGGV